MGKTRKTKRTWETWEKQEKLKDYYRLLEKYNDDLEKATEE